jgi:type VI secretion system protein ImpJ
MSLAASPAQPVVWHEGLFLAPQHFQQDERHLRWRLARLARSLHPHAWGLSALAIDGQALAHGAFALVAAEGIMPDGLAFSAGGDEAAPPSRQVELPAASDRFGVFLVAAAERAGAIAASVDGMVDGRPTRWRRLLREVRDEHGSGAREIPVAVPNLRLAFEGEPLDDAVWIRIAEVGRAPGGGLSLLDGFAPPSLSIAASAPLRACLRRVSEMAAARIAELSAQRRARARGQVEIAAADTVAYLALQALSAAMPAIVQAARVGDAHPAAVHAEVARLAGALCALSLERSAAELPEYRHETPLLGLLELEQVLRDLLTAGSSARGTTLPSRRPEERVVAAELPEHALDGARLFVAVHADLPAERLLRDVPLKAKIAALGRLDALIAQALRGLRLAFIAVPPAEVPARPGWTYFEIAREGDEWIAARDARSLAIALPAELASATIEFLAVRP